MDVLRTEITLRIHQGFALPGYRATIVHMHYCGLDHAVMTAREKAGGLEVDYGKTWAGHGRSIRVGNSHSISI